MAVAMHPIASIQPPLSGWESLDGCNAKAVASKIPTVTSGQVINIVQFNLICICKNIL